MDENLNNFIQKWYPDEPINERMITDVYNYGLRKNIQFVKTEELVKTIVRRTLEWYTNKKIYTLPKQLITDIINSIPDNDPSYE